MNREFHREARPDAVHSAKGILKNPCEVCHLVRRGVFKAVTMCGRDDPRLKGTLRSIGAIDKVGRCLLDHPQAVPTLLVDDVAVETSMLVREIISGARQFSPNIIENYWSPDDPRERVRDDCGWCASASQDEDRTDLRIAVEVRHTIAVHPQESLDITNRKGLPCGLVIRVFDDDLAGAAGRYFVIHSKAFAADVSFDLQEWGVLWNHADEPFRTVGRLAVRAIGSNL
jgi:hypothetical protein